MDRGLPEIVERRLNPVERYGARLTLFGAAIVLVFVPFGFLLEQVVNDGPLTRADTWAADRLNEAFHDNGPVIVLMQVFSWIGRPPVLALAVTVASIWLLRHGSHKLIVFLVVTTIAGGIIDTVVKEVVARPRPTVANPIHTAYGQSFPSGHAMSSLVCYGALVLVFLPLMSDRWKRVAFGGVIALVLAIGVSRLTLGVHYVSDVLGGYALGAAWLIASVAAFEIWREERGRRPTHPLTEGVEPEETRELVSS